MEFLETENKNIEPVSKVKMNLDGLLAPDIPSPLPKKIWF